MFFLDPELEADPTMKDVDSLTLSYTFFAAKPAKAASNGDADAEAVTDRQAEQRLFIQRDLR